MAALERFAETSDSFPLHRGRRPYIAHRFGPLPRIDLETFGVKRT
jgi:hypothetical protein